MNDGIKRSGMVGHIISNFYGSTPSIPGTPMSNKTTTTYSRLPGPSRCAESSRALQVEIPGYLPVQ